ncbi:MAG: hypothetical protein WCP79_07040 [Bacillota bacterium]
MNQPFDVLRDLSGRKLPILRWDIPTGSKKGESTTLLIPAGISWAKYHIADIISNCAVEISAAFARRGKDSASEAYATNVIKTQKAGPYETACCELDYLFASGNGASVTLMLMADSVADDYVEVIINEIGCR